jgi:hypothetical protein
MNMTTVIVLAPDLGSGYDFYEDLLANSTLPSHQIHFLKIDILARVVNDKLTTQILEINDQLLQVFKSLVASFTPSNKVIVTIASFFTILNGILAQLSSYSLVNHFGSGAGGYFHAERVICGH